MWTVSRRMVCSFLGKKTKSHMIASVVFSAGLGSPLCFKPVVLFVILFAFFLGGGFAYINKHDTSAKQTPKQRKSQTSQMLGKIPKRADKQSRTPTRISLSELGCFLFCPPVFGG